MSDVDKATAALRQIQRWHSPYLDGAMGYTDDGYGRVDPACAACGTPDEYAVPWPCAERKLADETLDALNEPSTP